jgi:hypothetical protein
MGLGMGLGMGKISGWIKDRNVVVNCQRPPPIRSRTTTVTRDALDDPNFSSQEQQRAAEDNVTA